MCLVCAGLWLEWSAESESLLLRGCCGGCAVVMSSYERQKSRILLRTLPRLAHITITEISEITLSEYKFQSEPKYYTSVVRVCECWFNNDLFSCLANRETKCTNQCSLSSSKVTNWRTGSKRFVRGQYCRGHQYGSQQHFVIFFVHLLHVLSQ